MQSISFVPLNAMFLSGILEKLDEGSLRSARDLGASGGAILRDIVLPLIRPATLVCLLLSFVRSLADFGTPIIIGGRFSTLAADIYLQVVGYSDLEKSSAMNMFLLIPSIVFFFVYRALMRRSDKLTDASRTAQTELGLSLPHCGAMGWGMIALSTVFFVMIVLGVNQGMQPIAGYNFGAKQYDRVMRVLKLTMIGATCVTTAGFLLGEFMPRLAVGMFTSDEELIRLAVEGMRIVFFCFPIIGFQMVATNFFMSIGMAGKAIFLSLSRQLLFLMPGLIFLPHIFDVHTRWDGSWGVWCAMPLSDLMASVVAFFMLVYQLRKFRAQMDAARSTNLQ